MRLEVVLCLVFFLTQTFELLLVVRFKFLEPLVSIGNHPTDVLLVYRKSDTRFLFWRENFVFDFRLLFLGESVNLLHDLYVLAVHSLPLEDDLWVHFESLVDNHAHFIFDLGALCKHVVELVLIQIESLVLHH